MTDAPKDGGPAFPHPEPRDPMLTTVASGLSKRDWFAGQALAGACAMWCESAGRSADPDADVARWAYEIADAMLAVSEVKP